MGQMCFLFTTLSPNRFDVMNNIYVCAMQKEKPVFKWFRYGFTLLSFFPRLFPFLIFLFKQNVECRTHKMGMGGMVCTTCLDGQQIFKKKNAALGMRL